MVRLGQLTLAEAHAAFAPVAETVQRFARRYAAGNGAEEREELTANALAHAWIMWRAKLVKHGMPFGSSSGFAHYAWLRARAREAWSSEPRPPISTHLIAKRPDYWEGKREMDEMAGGEPGLDPCEMAASRERWKRWLAALSRSHRKAIKLLAQGYTVAETARMLGKSTWSVWRARVRAQAALIALGD